MKTILLLLFLFIPFISGCAQQEIKIIKEKQFIVNRLPDELLKACSISPLATEKYFKSLNCSDRTEYLTMYSARLINDLKNCNLQIENIKSWNINQDKIIGEK